MKVDSISLMEAYIIESVRKSGITNEELVESVSKKDIASWRQAHLKFDFHILIDLYEKDARAFHSIIHDGYQIKFITINGLKNLLKLKFDITEEVYELTEQGIANLYVDDNTLYRIRQMLSPNWKVQEKEVDGKHRVSIILNR
ncbi:hypothetical protein [Virgibacillus kimchii]